MNIKEILAEKQEEVKEEKEAEKKGTFYSGEFNLVAPNAQRIKKIGQDYFPANDEEIAELEYQVSVGRVTKEVF